MGSAILGYMRLRNPGGLVAALSMLVLAVGCSPNQSESSRPPNVLLVSIDTLRPDHLHAYGYDRPTSPTIDRLAREGARFENAIAPTSWTLPSHITLLTGLPPSAHGVTKGGRRLLPEATTLAEIFHRTGYETVGFVSGPFLRAIYGYEQGFDRYDDEIATPILRASHSDVTSPKLVEKLLGWLGDRDDSRPFFAFLHMWDPHYDFIPPPPYDTMFDPDYEGTMTGENFTSSKDFRWGMDERDFEHVLALYDGEIRYTDDHLGQIIEALESQGLLDDTIIVVTSDHGEEFLEHRRKGHAQSLFEEVIRIPLVVRYPKGVRAGAVFDDQVRLADVAPTIVGLAGVDAAGFPSVEAPVFGARDLSLWLAGDRALPSFPRLLAVGSLQFMGLDASSVRTNQTKVIRTRSKKATSTAAFDMVKDPMEKRSLSRGRPLPDEARDLLEEEAEWDAAWSTAPVLSRSFKEDAAQEQRLRALGYME